MTTIYLVACVPADEHWIVAAFSTREKADAYIAAIDADQRRDYRVEVFVLDQEEKP